MNQERRTCWGCGLWTACFVEPCEVCGQIEVSVCEPCVEESRGHVLERQASTHERSCRAILVREYARLPEGRAGRELSRRGLRQSS